MSNHYYNWIYFFLFQKKIKFLTLLFFLTTGILFFLCLPSLFFQITEGWSYSEGIYFAFITLSTIGFGDYVVGKVDFREETQQSARVMAVITMGWLHRLPLYYRDKSSVWVWLVFALYSSGGNTHFSGIACADKSTKLPKHNEMWCFGVQRSQVFWGGKGKCRGRIQGA